MPLAQDHLAAIRKQIGQTLRPLGFRVVGKRSWIRGDAERGWIGLTYRGDKWNDKQAAEASLECSVWPSGTLEFHNLLAGSDGDPFVAANSPLSADPRVVLAHPTANNANTWAVRADMEPDEVRALGEQAQEYAARLTSWAAEMLDARKSADLMPSTYAVAALLAAGAEAEAVPHLDALTAWFQRDPRPIELGRHITEWRSRLGLVRAVLPVWQRYAPPRNNRTASPRDAILQGIGTGLEFRFADGTTRAPTPEDVPDIHQLARWRAERAAAPLPEGVLGSLPEWLPYAAWLDLPAAPVASEAAVPRRRWWRR